MYIWQSVEVSFEETVSTSSTESHVGYATNPMREGASSVPSSNSPLLFFPALAARLQTMQDLYIILQYPSALQTLTYLVRDDRAYRFPDNISVDEGFHDRTALRDPSKPNTCRRMKAKLKVELHLRRVYLPPFLLYPSNKTSIRA
ncbi:hypothetical protein BT69DRAFT_1316603, partial [Atractiella rhizophila]